MKILLTNDDGFDSPGLKALADALHDLGGLYLAAPARQQSGTGHGISVFDPIRVKPWALENVEQAWIVEGTPVDCVKLALSALIAEPIDLVVSGINVGPNLGSDVLYSGTVAAAAEAAIIGVQAIAVSRAGFEAQSDFSYAAQFVKQIIRWLRGQELPPGTLLNVNVPKDAAAIQGIRLARLGQQNYHNTFEGREDPRGNTYYWLGGRVVETDAAEDTDLYLLRRKYETKTPLQMDLTNYTLLENCKRDFYND
jgi:5'-nucleotidase